MLHGTVPAVRSAIILAMVAVVATACTRSSGGDAATAEARSRAQLIDAQGQTIGTAMLALEGEALNVTVEAERLPPGTHGMHIHENGTCTPPDFTSAGGHFNPGNREHGLRNPNGPHAGDLPNLEVRPDGTVDTTITLAGAQLAAGAGDLLGGAPRALVIHAGPDDMTTDPSGNSGDRIACGVLERT